MDKAKRKPNFSEGEKYRLCEEYENVFNVVTGKFSANISNKKKHDAWQNITSAMNRRNPSVTRSDADYLKKWQNLCSNAKDEYRKYRKELAKTGGGPAPVEPSLISQKVLAILGEDDPTLTGIEGGIENTPAVVSNTPTTSTSTASGSSSSSTDSIREQPFCYHVDESTSSIHHDLGIY
ncbi:uncharacterized protein LOC135494047 [Lineus longissimus]|uniref:uncharacterized protein LOC135494047 n=1 Tax=Lineus longissimus TaxID=88925 RepID=UPI00315DDF41